MASKIDSIGLGGEVRRLRASGASLDDLREMLAEQGCHVSLASISRYCGGLVVSAEAGPVKKPRRSPKPRPAHDDEPATPAEVVATGARLATRVSGRRPSAEDAPDFLGAAWDMQLELRQIAGDDSQHPQLRATAMEVARDLLVEGHEMSTDLYEART